MKVECVACGKELPVSEASSGMTIRVEANHECNPKIVWDKEYGFYPKPGELGDILS